MIPPIQQALHLHRSGRSDEAEAIFRQLLSESPNLVPALHHYAVFAAETNRLDLAEDLLRKAATLDPHDATIFQQLGDVLLARGKKKQAIAVLERAAYLQPGSALPLCALARALPPAQAIPILQRALAVDPNHQPARRLHASGLLDIGQLRLAADEAERAVTLNPKDGQSWNILGTALARQQQSRCISAFRKSIENDPQFVPAHQNLALALANMNQLDDAEQQINKAIALLPQNGLLFSTLAIIYQRQGRMELAIDAARKSVQFDPDFSGFHSNLLLFLNYSSKLTPQQIADEHRAWGQKQMQFPRISLTNDRDPDHPLRIGFISADFRNQSVAYFFEPLLANLDRNQFESFCYYNYASTDDGTARIKKLAANWRDIITATDEQVAQQIVNDKIDILFDLGGHTGENRLPIFARKPAPIQITWLGYPNTTGLSTIDYRITDPIADPPGKTEHLHTEKLLRLQSAWCYVPPPNCPAVMPSPAQVAAEKGDANSPIIFGAFNILSKFSDECLALWADLLQQIPNSRMFIKSKGLGPKSPQQRILDIFKSHNIDPARIDLKGAEPFHSSHLKAHALVDIMLDPFPYNGTTTTCESLYLGVPVITLMGNTHVSRVGASLLTSAGLPDLIADSPEQYIQIAKALASDRARLAHLRTTLRDQMKSSRLMDAKDFTQQFQQTLRDVWKTW